MKKYLLKFVIAFMLALVLTIFLYWPIYQKLPLSNSQSNISTELRELDLPLSDDVKEILNRRIDLPKDRHKLCLENKNKIYMIHSDSDTLGPPFVFRTDDISQYDYGRENNVGAMAITLNYQNNLSEDRIYRNVGDPKSCIVLNVNKLKDYDNATIEYHHIKLDLLEEFDLGERGNVAVLRSIVNESFIDTSNSSAYIVAQWNFLLLTLAALLVIFFATVNFLAKNSQKILPIFTKFLKKKVQYDTKL